MSIVTQRTVARQPVNDPSPGVDLAVRSVHGPIENPAL
jgi:hypothetical protein